MKRLIVCMLAMSACPLPPSASVDAGPVVADAGPATTEATFFWAQGEVGRLRADGTCMLVSRRAQGKITTLTQVEHPADSAECAIMKASSATNLETRRLLDACQKARVKP